MAGGIEVCVCVFVRYRHFSGWPSIFMSSSGPAQHALGRPQDRRSAAGSTASSGLLQEAACPPSLAELIFCLHSVACFSSIGPTLLFRMFSAFSDVDSKVSVCVCVCVCVCVGSGVAARFFCSV